MFELDPAETVPNGIARVLNDTFDEAERQLDVMASPDPAEIERAVHQFRKRSKELRSVALMVRPALGPAFRRFNHLVRDASAELSASRDAHVMLKTIDSLADRSDRSADFTTIRDRQRVVAESATTALQRGDGNQGRIRNLLAAARHEAAEWDLPDSTAPVAQGLVRTYRRGQEALRVAERLQTDDTMHEWRKSVKNLWYEARLLAAADGIDMAKLVEELDSIGSLLGEDHDLAVLIERIGQAPGGMDVCELARARQLALRENVLQLGNHIYSEIPEDFVDRIIAGWRRAQSAARPISPT